MLVTFTSPAHADISFLGDIALKLLHLMGHSGKIPGALKSEDIPEALAKLEAAVETEKEKLLANRPVEEEDEEDPPVPLSHRALPLIDLLRAALKADSYVMWE